MASIRTVKRSRVSYDGADPGAGGGVVSASLGMFAASEHWGLYVDACQLAEIMLWGKADHTASAQKLLVVPSLDHMVLNGSRSTNYKTVLEPLELFRQGSAKDADKWISEDGMLTLERSETVLGSDGQPVENTFALTAKPTALRLPEKQFILYVDPMQDPRFFEPKLGDTPMMQGFEIRQAYQNAAAARRNAGSERELGAWAYQADTYGFGELKDDVFIGEAPPPVALKLAESWYVFDAPCIFDESTKRPHLGMRCSALGNQSPIVQILEISEADGAWSMLPYMSIQDWGAEFEAASSADAALRKFAKVSAGSESTIVMLHEQATGGGKGFVASWNEARRMGETVEVKLLWGAARPDFWDRTLNTAKPWAASNLGSFSEGAEVEGRLLETGASLAERTGLGIAGEETAVSASESTEKFELVALSSMRFMRDSSVAYPTTIVSFDGGSSGWALEMFDSVSVNAVELVFFLLSGHFQL